MNDLTTILTVLTPIIGSFSAYMVNREKKFRSEIKELNSIHRKDIKELMSSSKKERDEQRTSLERMSTENNKIMNKLILTVAELKVMVSARLKA